MSYSRENETKRRHRLQAARRKGTHTVQEWQEMKEFFNNTCCCCLGVSGLINVEKDHIVALRENGSDSIHNLQPLCALCNVKNLSGADHRPIAAAYFNVTLPDKYKLKEEFSNG